MNDRKNRAAERNPLRRSRNITRPLFTGRAAPAWKSSCWFLLPPACSYCWVFTCADKTGSHAHRREFPRRFSGRNAKPAIRHAPGGKRAPGMLHEQLPHDPCDQAEKESQYAEADLHFFRAVDQCAQSERNARLERPNGRENRRRIHVMSPPSRIFAALSRSASSPFLRLGDSSTDL